MGIDLKTFIAEQLAHHPIEATIVRKVITALHKNGTPVVAVYDTEEEVKVTTTEEILENVFNLDECWLLTADRSWVRIVLGNEQDCICDYTVNLEEVLAPVNAFIERRWG